MNHLEKNAVRIVAKLSPWLAPFPSAYFVARSAVVHLALPLPVAIVVAVIIETLGLATVHTALWAYDWNAHCRKSDPAAPLGLCIALGGVYVAATLGLVVCLEVWPSLATYAPALFPALAVVGALNLAMISRQEQREAAVELERAERKAQRQTARQETRAEPSSIVSKTAVLNTSLDAARRTRKVKRDARLDALVTFYASNPEAGPTEAGSAIGVSRQTVYAYLDELESAGRIQRNDGQVQVQGRG